MQIRAMLFALTVLAIARMAGAANTPPLSGEWNIAPSGTASSSGELLFRVTPGDGSDATEVTVSVSSGTDETGVASNIRRALSTQLRGDRFDVEAGQGANVLVKSSGKTGFSLELVDSDVENIRVAVQSAQPVVAAHRAEAGDASQSTDHHTGDAAGTRRCGSASARAR